MDGSSRHRGSAGQGTRRVEMLDLAGAIHAAAFGELPWSEAVAHIAGRFRAAGAAFYAQSLDSKHFRETAVLGIDREHVRSFREHFAHRDNPWTELRHFGSPGVVRTRHALQAHLRDRHAFDRHPYFRQWLAPQGFQHSIGMKLVEDDDASVKLTLYRERDQRDFAGLDVSLFRGLCAHLQQALRQSRRFERLEAALRAATGALDRLPYGVVFLDRRARVDFMNHVAARLVDVDAAIRIRDGRLRLASPDADRQLHAAVAAAAASDREAPHAGAHALGVVSASVGRRLTLTVMATPRNRGLPGLGQSAVIVLITDPELDLPGVGEFLQERYALTATEARLARRLLAGASLREASQAMGIAYETARGYLKALFRKTDTNSQPQLLRCLTLSFVLPAE